MFRYCEWSLGCKRESFSFLGKDFDRLTEVGGTRQEAALMEASCFVSRTFDDEVYYAYYAYVICRRSRLIWESIAVHPNVFFYFPHVVINAEHNGSDWNTGRYDCAASGDDTATYLIGFI